MSKTPRASKRLAHARIYLDLLRAENKKLIGKERQVIEAHTSACLGAIKSALYHLKKEVGAQTYEVTLAKWKGTLDRLEKKRFQRMQDLRDLDVHVTDIPTTAKEKAIPSFMVPGVHVVAPLPFVGGWVMAYGVHLDADEAATTCEKFLTLAEQFVAEFR